jgi:hypothetical protein
MGSWYPESYNRELGHPVKLKKNVPQRLKPAFILIHFGTTEVVP